MSYTKYLDRLTAHPANRIISATKTAVDSHDGVAGDGLWWVRDSKVSGPATEIKFHHIYIYLPNIKAMVNHGR